MSAVLGGGVSTRHGGGGVEVRGAGDGESGPLIKDFPQYSDNK